MPAPLRLRLRLRLHLALRVHLLRLFHAPGSRPLKARVAPQPLVIPKIIKLVTRRRPNRIPELIHLPGQTPVVDGQVAAMAQARGFAPRAVLAAGNSVFCASDAEGASNTSAVTFATIVLPPRPDGSFDAYVLNGPIEEGAIPLGKHFRVGFDAFGLAGEPELVTDTCEVVTWDSSDADLAMSVYVTEYDGTAPTPIHVFISSLLPMSMGVVTGDIIWPMAGGAIAAPVPAAEAGYTPAE